MPAGGDTSPSAHSGIDAAGPPAAPAAHSRHVVFMFTDIADSTRLKQPGALGAAAYAEMARRHDEIFRRLVGAVPGAEILKDVGDGFMAAFPTASDAVRTALRFQHALATGPAFTRGEHALRVRIGIHQGEVAVLDLDVHGKPKIIGPAADMSARVQALALPGQVLVSRAAFNDARQYVREHPVCGEGDGAVCPLLRWLAHGHYRFKGVDDPEEVYEVGAEGSAPLNAPPDTEKAKYVGSPDDEAVRGWRPAVGQAIPGRAHWLLESRLGEGGFGEAWLARHAKTKDRRVFKFCFDPNRLRSLRREITLFRLLREALGDRPDIARLHEFQLDKPPFFLESEYSELGDLAAWAQTRGGIASIPLPERLEIIARVAEAVAAAHSVGVLHKDLKPSNILMYKAEDGSVRPRLADFGIGILTDRTLAEGRGITVAGFTAGQLTDNASSRTGTRMYAPPELDAGKPFTTAGDVYALGVLFYQIVVADLARPLGTGWDSDIADPLLREGIAAATMGDPARRLPSAAALASWVRDLEAERARRAAAADAARRAREDAEHAAQRERRLRQLRAWGAALSAALIVLAALTAFALVQRREAVRARDAIERNAYVANVQMAEAAIDLRLVSRARNRLDACPSHLRGWEWVRLDAALDESLVLLTGHTRPVRHAAFSPNGSRIVTASADGTARVWDTATGATLAELRGHAHWVHSAAFSPDGTRILTASFDNTARVWDAATGATLAELKGHKAGAADLVVAALTGKNGVNSAAFSPDGTRIVTASDDSTARVWDAATGATLAELRHARQVHSAAFSPDGTRIVTASYDSTARVWDAVTATTLAELRHARQVHSAAFSPDGTRIVTASWDATARVWDAATGATLAELSGHAHQVRSAAFSPDGTRIVTASDDSTVRVWDAGTGETLAELRGHTGWVGSAAFSPDGARVVTASRDGTARIWDAATGASLAELVGHDGWVSSAAFSPDGTLVVTASDEESARVWDATTGATFADLNGHTEWAGAAAFSPDGSRIVTTSEGGAARVWETATATALAELKGHTGVVNVAAFSPDGARVVTVSGDRTARVWDAATGAMLTELKGHKNVVRSAAFSPNGARIVTTSGEVVTRVWGAATGAMLAELEGHTSVAFSAAFSPDGTRVITASVDMTARVWDAATGATLVELMGHTMFISAAFSPDGTRIVTASGEETARVWDAATGATLAELKGHTGGVRTAAFSADGTRIVTASWDKTARVWDAVTGASLAELKGHTGRVESAAFSPDGTRVVTASADGTARLWDAATGADLTELTGKPSGLFTVMVLGAAFSPDGTRVVTSSDGRTVRVWDSIPNRIRYAEGRENTKGRDGGAIVKAWLAAVRKGTEKDFKLPPLD